MTADEVVKQESNAAVQEQRIATNYVQLSKLPNLEEVAHENPIEFLLAQSLLLQLKCLKKDISISQLAFDDLCFFASLQLDDLLQSLKKLTHVHRRTQISKIDLDLFFKGTGINFADLYEQVEVSNYVHNTFSNESQMLTENVNKVKKNYMHELSETELLSSKQSEFFVQDVDILNLLPSTNKSNKYVPTWLPELPPDHTYKFTALYNKPITDERLMKQKLVAEGRLSEKALINMLSHGKASQDEAKDNALLEQLKESELEKELIFGRGKRNFSKNSDAEIIRSLPLKGFDVVEYSKSRVALKKRRLEEEEWKILNRRKNPLIRSAMLCSPYGNGNIKSRKTVENQLKTFLKRSYLGLVHSIPRIKEERAKARKEAEQRDILMQEQRKREKESKMAEQEVLDLNNMQNDPLLHGLDGDSDEEEDDDNNKEVEHTLEEDTTQLSDSQPAIDAERNFETLNSSAEPSVGSESQTPIQLIAPTNPSQLTPAPSEDDTAVVPNENQFEGSGPATNILDTSLARIGIDDLPETAPSQIDHENHNSPS